MNQMSSVSGCFLSSEGAHDEGDGKILHGKSVILALEIGLSKRRRKLEGSGSFLPKDVCE